MHKKATDTMSWRKDHTHMNPSKHAKEGMTVPSRPKELESSSPQASETGEAKVPEPEPEPADVIAIQRGELRARLVQYVTEYGGRTHSELHAALAPEMPVGLFSEALQSASYSGGIENFGSTYWAPRSVGDAEPDLLLRRMCADVARIEKKVDLLAEILAKFVSRE